MLTLMLAQRLLDCGEPMSLITKGGDPSLDRGRGQRWQEVGTDACDPLMSGLLDVRFIRG